MKRFLIILILCASLAVLIGACDDGISGVAECKDLCDKLGECDKDGDLLIMPVSDCKQICEMSENPGASQAVGGSQECDLDATCDDFRVCLFAGGDTAEEAACKNYCDKLLECDGTGEVTEESTDECKETCEAAYALGNTEVDPRITNCNTALSCTDYAACLSAEE